MQQLVAHHSRFWIKNLQKTFSTITVEQVASELKKTTEETTQYLETLIDQRQINATIERHASDSSGGPILRLFPDSTSGPLAKSEKEQFNHLESQVRTTEMMADYVRIADERHMLTKDYVLHEKKRESDREMDRPGGPNVGSADIEAGELTDNDEDLMVE